MYGGPGNDTLVGSQASDIIVGGSGDDLVLGERGEDLIVGDDGVNLDLLASTSSLVTVPSATVLAVPPPNADPLVAGHDVLIGEGLGSAPSLATNHDDDGDVIIGDLGAILQDVLERRTWLFDEATLTFDVQDPRPLAGETTGVLLVVLTSDPDNGVSDTLEGDLGNDLLLGGGGSDTIWGNSGNDLVFGDFGLVMCTGFTTGMAGCRIDLTLLPLDVALNNHTFSWTSFFTGADENWGNDLINGNAGQDILIGGAGSDRITGGSGDDDLIGGNTGDAYLGLAGTGGAGGYNAGVDYSAGLIYGDDWDATGGIDGPHSACNTDADCTYGDFLDGGSGNDVLAGDNATILRTGSTAGPRFRALSGNTLISPVTRVDRRRGLGVHGHLAVRVVRPVRTRARLLHDVGLPERPARDARPLRAAVRHGRDRPADLLRLRHGGRRQ